MTHTVTDPHDGLARPMLMQAAAALKARSLAQTEEKQIQALITQIVRRQLSKLQSKLANFEKVNDVSP